MQTQQSPQLTSERLLLAAIFYVMKPRKRDKVIALIGQCEADNIVNLRSPIQTSAAQRSKAVLGALRLIEHNRPASKGGR